MKALSNIHTGIYSRLAKQEGVTRQRINQILKDCTCTYKYLADMGWRFREISGHAKGCKKFK